MEGRGKEKKDELHLTLFLILGPKSPFNGHTKRTNIRM